MNSVWFRNASLSREYPPLNSYIRCRYFVSNCLFRSRDCNTYVAASCLNEYRRTSEEEGKTNKPSRQLGCLPNLSASDDVIDHTDCEQCDGEDLEAQTHKSGICPSLRRSIGFGGNRASNGLEDKGNDVARDEEVVEVLRREPRMFDRDVLDASSLLVLR